MQPIRLSKRACDALRLLAAIGGRMPTFPTVRYRLLQVRIRDLEPPVLGCQLNTEASEPLVAVHGEGAPLLCAQLEGG
jgi:hypothetical protein